MCLFIKRFFYEIYSLETKGQLERSYVGFS